jgi:hypothetical protein
MSDDAPPTGEPLDNDLDEPAPETSDDHAEETEAFDESELTLGSVDYEELLSELSEREENPRWQRQFEREFSESAIQGEVAYAHLRGLTDHYRHKGKWSWFLMGLMGFMVVYQSVLLWMVGAGYWDFSRYDWLLPILLVQNFAQIVGLALFVVKALFSAMKMGS